MIRFIPTFLYHATGYYRGQGVDKAHFLNCDKIIKEMLGGIEETSFEGTFLLTRGIFEESEVQIGRYAL